MIAGPEILSCSVSIFISCSFAKVSIPSRSAPVSKPFSESAAIERIVSIGSHSFPGSIFFSTRPNKVYSRGSENACSIGPRIYSLFNTTPTEFSPASSRKGALCALSIFDISTATSEVPALASRKFASPPMVESTLWAVFATARRPFDISASLTSSITSLIFIVDLYIVRFPLLISSNLSKDIGVIRTV